jgi:ATP-dependent RNA helicase DeaD
MVNNKRIADFKQRIYDTLATGELAYLQRLVEEFSRDHDVPAERVSAALARMCIGDQPLLLNTKAEPAAGKKQLRDKKHKGKEHKGKEQNTDQDRKPVNANAEQHDNRPHKDGQHKDKQHKDGQHNAEQQRIVEQPKIERVKAQQPAVNERRQQPAKPPSAKEHRANASHSSIEMERFRVEVGKTHGLKPENLVGAIANEVGLDAEFIGRISINENHSLVELPAGMPKFLFKDLKRVWVCEHRLNISRVTDTNRQTKNKAEKHTETIIENSKRASGGKSTRKAASAQGNRENPGTELSVKRKEKQLARRKKERHRDRKNKGKKK